jgi:hypothetical protein
MTTDPLVKLQKTAKKSAQTMAKQAAKMVKEEREGLLESAKKQVVGEKKDEKKGPTIYQELVGNGKVSSQEEARIKGSTQGRIQKLEAELARLRAERQRKEQQWSQAQEELMKKPDGEEGDSDFVAPPTSPQKGPVGPAGKKKTKGTGEMIRKRN